MASCVIFVKLVFSYNFIPDIHDFWNTFISFGYYDCSQVTFYSVNLSRFIRSEEDDRDTSWEQRLVKRYYDKLFKEYPLSFFKYFSFFFLFCFLISSLQVMTSVEVIHTCYSNCYILACKSGQFICCLKLV